MSREIGRGAEAVITLSGETVLKDRIPKTYRHPAIDNNLRKSRTRKETKILGKLPGIAPIILSSDSESKIEMEHIKGPLLKEVLDKKPELAKEIGKITGILHDKHIMHGDLTTSNMILDSNGKIRLIDFGLSQDTHKVEDKAVDLHLFKEAVESKHFKHMNLIWENFLKGYKPSNRKEILERLEIVEARGRNKEKY